jgi:D-xylose transport system ATP-binding protein
MAPVLEVRDAHKRFGGVSALNGVSLTLGKGEVLALLGDNGAGKSTLMKCISGAHSLDEGEIRIGGQPVTLRTPHDARRHGIETVYQDLALFDNLNVVANFYAGRELTWPKGVLSAGWMREREMTVKAREMLRRLEVNIPDPRASVGLLSGGQRQAIAVARAVTFAAKVVILDEPTAALGLRETGNVLRMVKRLPEQGISVILISHNLEQVMEVADRVVVLRRGVMVGEAPPSEDHHERIVGMIMGSGSVLG